MVCMRTDVGGPVRTTRRGTALLSDGAANRRLAADGAQSTAPSPRCRSQCNAPTPSYQPCHTPILCNNRHHLTGHATHPHSATTDTILPAMPHTHTLQQPTPSYRPCHTTTLCNNRHHLTGHATHPHSATQLTVKMIGKCL